MMEIGFKRVSLGYNPEEVDRTIDKLIAENKQKDMQIEEYKAKFQELDARFDALDKQQIADRTLIANTMIAARQDAGRVLEHAKNEADRIVGEASDQAKGIVEEANQEAKRIVTGAEAIADEINNRINNEYMQTKSVLLGITESTRDAKAELIQMFEASENRLLEMLDNVGQMLPETAVQAEHAEKAEGGFNYYAAVAPIINSSPSQSEYHE